MHVFDYSNAVETFLGNKEALHRVLEKFIENVEAQIITIEKSIQKGDTEKIKMEAHAIKGGALSLEAQKLGQKAAEMDQAAKAGDLETIKRQFPKFRETFTEFKNYVFTNVFNRNS